MNFEPHLRNEKPDDKHYEMPSHQSLEKKLINSNLLSPVMLIFM